MFKINPYYEQITNDTILWRYMSLSKLQSLLNTESIFFAKVAAFKDDPLEGTYNKISEDHYIQWMLSDKLTENINTVSEEVRQRLYQNLDNLLKLSKKFKELVLISCWHINKSESIDMWRRYSNYKTGIAIRTTYGRLKESLKDSDNPIYGGKVRYIDTKKDRITFGNTLAPFIAKGINFLFENELRLVTQIKYERYFEYDWSKEKFDTGSLIPCNIKLLIDGVFVSPKCSDAFKLKVQQLFYNKCLDKEVQKSSLILTN